MAFHAGKQTTLATLPKGAARFKFATTDQPVAGGQLHGDALYEISLEDNTPVVYSTKLGTRERTLRYRYTGDLRFSHGTVTFHDGSFFYYLQQSKPDTEAARPLHVFRVDLPPEE